MSADTSSLRAWHVRNIDRALRETGMSPEEIEAGLQAVRDTHAHELAPQLSEAERKFLSWALDQAANEMQLGGGGDSEDWSAMATLRKLAGGEAS